MDERNFTYMFYGFTAAWVIVVLYVLTMVRREGKLRSELERVKHMIEDREKK
jgi:CcmD family protein